jgi:hypothetical protein
MTIPFARQHISAATMDLALISGLLSDMAGLKKKSAMKTNTTLPSMIRGMIHGTALISGFPVIKKAVTGVIIDRISAQLNPAIMTHSIRHRLMIGPVIYTLKFLKNWLAMQIARRIALMAICLVNGTSSFFLFIDAS